MGAPDVDPLPEAPPARLRFDRYVLDRARGCLLGDDGEIVLRPKTFAVLAYLVANAGRLVSKDDVFAAVWPDVAVTDDTLVQSIGELRRALGADGLRLVRTVPRRGYRFEAVVSAAEDAAPEPAGPSAVSPPAEPPGDPPARSGGRRLLHAVLVLALVLAGAALAGASGWLAPLGIGGSRDRQPLAASARPVIAVLPFANQSDDADRDYFVDGLTQDVINLLGSFPTLTVMSWNAVARYKGGATPPGEIAGRLGAAYHVEGGVRRTDDRVRVTAQLVDADGRVRWSGRFDEALVDVFRLQDRVTAEIAGSLATRVTRMQQRRALERPGDSLDAYDRVLRARPALQRPSRENNVEARALLRRAIELDPGSAAAHAALAEAHYLAVSMGWAQSPLEFLDRAEAMANRALALDEAEVHAHVVLGRLHIFHQRYEQARAAMDRALAINPSDAHAIAGRGNVLMWSGETSAAIAALELAQRIDPALNAMDGFALGLAYYLERRYDAAIAQANASLRNAEGARFSLVLLAAAHAQSDRPEEAGRAVEAIRSLDPTFDGQAFGSKFLNAADLEHLRDGLRKAGLRRAAAFREPSGD